jgi:hypothetical protein
MPVTVPAVCPACQRQWGTRAVTAYSSQWITALARRPGRAGYRRPRDAPLIQTWQCQWSDSVPAGAAGRCRGQALVLLHPCCSFVAALVQLCCSSVAALLQPRSPLLPGSWLDHCRLQRFCTLGRRAHRDRTP